VDGNGRKGGNSRGGPRGLGRPTRRSATFNVFAVLLVLIAVAVVLTAVFLSAHRAAAVLASLSAR
jgi:hypothetical protein